jgi:hypothetical protein
MESISEKMQERKPYAAPAVVYEAELQVNASTTVSTNPLPPNDLFGTGKK